jgi:hypothetical protein
MAREERMGSLAHGRRKFILICVEELVFECREQTQICTRVLILEADTL